MHKVTVTPAWPRALKSRSSPSALWSEKLRLHLSYEAWSQKPGPVCAFRWVLARRACCLSGFVLLTLRIVQIMCPNYLLSFHQRYHQINLLRLNHSWHLGWSLQRKKAANVYLERVGDSSRLPTLQDFSLRALSGGLNLTAWPTGQWGAYPAQTLSRSIFITIYRARCHEQRSARCGMGIFVTVWTMKDTREYR